jgi:hypothetical protein
VGCRFEGRDILVSGARHSTVVMWMMWKEWTHVLKMGLLGKDEVDYVHWQEIVVYKSF